MMFRQATCRNRENRIRIMLLIVLSALMMNGMVVLHHATEDAPATVYELCADTHDDYLLYAEPAAGVVTPPTTGMRYYPERSPLVSRILYSSFFHPPRAS
jgi:hypothetical protein